MLLSLNSPKAIITYFPLSLLNILSAFVKKKKTSVDIVFARALF